MTDAPTPVPTREKVLIIGAGPAGLAAAAALQALRIPFDLVDRSRHVGGIWDTERSDTPVWPAMEMVSSRDFTQYDDLLQPVSFPEFLNPEQMGKYLRAYAARHRLTEHFRPGVTVRYARPFEEGVWQVELSTGEILVYSAVISAHGISERPHLPAWAAEVPAGIRVMHAKEWEGSSGLEGLRVLVVGSGQSAADIAVDAARRALEVGWSMRTGHWIVPRRIAGMPGDVAAAREPAVLGRLNAKVAEAVVSRAVGDPEAAGLPRPSAGILEDRVIISDDVLDRVREGRITPMGEVTGIAADGTVIATGPGGSVASGAFAPDLIVFATGYASGADHLPQDLVPRTGSGELDLFLGAFPRGRSDLIVLGQQRVTGGVLPVLVEQADTAAYLLRAVREGSPALTRFEQLRAGSDHAVPVREPGRGLRARLSGALAPAAGPRSPFPGRGQAAESLVPFADRDELLARLRTVRDLLSRPA